MKPREPPLLKRVAWRELTSGTKGLRGSLDVVMSLGSQLRVFAGVHRQAEDEQKGQHGGARQTQAVVAGASVSSEWEKREKREKKMVPSRIRLQREQPPTSSGGTPSGWRCWTTRPDVWRLQRGRAPASRQSFRF